MALDLIKRNNCQNFVILERSSSVGGTWNDNKYPGCCCDGKETLNEFGKTILIEHSVEFAV
jgi:cation diffusion facilitator CzcD-associated flavoprotein CzcO